MIAAAAVGAGIALASSADQLGLTVRVYGTPAEEAGGGKILMVERGAFDGVHAAMMVHPAPSEWDVFPTLASNQCDYRMHGRTSHSSMAPQLGVNAGDALTVGQVAVGLLRQHLEPGPRLRHPGRRGGQRCARSRRGDIRDAGAFAWPAEQTPAAHRPLLRGRCAGHRSDAGDCQRGQPVSRVRSRR